MKTKILAMILVVSAAITACSHDDNPVITPVPMPAANGFTWKENGGASQSAATATFSTQYKTLMAKDNTGATLFEINLSGTTPATYTVGANNAITYVAANPYYTATSGSIIIASNAGGKMSGSFRSTGSSGSLTAVEGTFTNIDVVP